MMAEYRPEEPTADEIRQRAQRNGPERIPWRVRTSVAQDLLLFGTITHRSRTLYPRINHIGAGVYEVRWSRDHWTGEPRQEKIDASDE